MNGIRVARIALIAFAAARPHGAAAAAELHENDWQADRDAPHFRGGALAIDAELPNGYSSLSVKDSRFLAGGPGYGAMAFRPPEGTWVASFTEIGNASHDDRQGSPGGVSDGMYSRATVPGRAVSTARQVVRPSDKPGTNDLPRTLST
jgi:hypothetical protein